LGVLLAVLLVFSGRLIRQKMLLDPNGNWQEHLWLEALIVGPDTAEAADKPSRTVLTSPLPINTCSLDSLTLLPGVGPVLAGRIAETRRSGVVFCNADDLKRVKGIGPALSARLDSLVLYTLPTVPDSLTP